MKLALFTNPANYIEWAQREVELIRKNGYRLAVESYEDAKAGRTRAAYFKMNPNIPAEYQDEAWAHQLDWLRGQVQYLERKIKKYEREIKKAQALQ